jgi:hypothetical protein
MLLLGLLLVLACGAFAVVAVEENLSAGPDYTVGLFGHHIATLSAPGLFLSGVALTLVFCLGLLMLSAGLRHHRRTRAGLRTARHEAAQAAAERDALAARLDESRPDGAAGESPTPATPSRPVLFKGLRRASSGTP